jgi:alanine racemase
MSDARSIATIDLTALRHNASRLARAAGGAELMAVVKANGYGHGAVPCAQAALDGGAGSLAVASVEEAEELRLGGVSARILIMSPLAGAGFDRALAAGCEVVVGDDAGVRGMAAAAGPGRPARVHVEVDTGMGRLGVAPDGAMALAEAADAAGCEVVGLMTHFATADERVGPEAGFMMEQLVRFRQLVPAFRDRFPGAQVHASNSAATLRDPDAAFDMVRCGIALYGCSPFGGDPSDDDLIPVMHWTSRLAQVKPFTSRMSAGYGRTWRAARGTWVGIIPVGYADGFSRDLSNTDEVLVGGRRVPVVGTVSMDLVAVDLGPEAVERGGEEVVIIGRQGDERITADEIARRRGSISYEVTCAVSPRVARVHQG